MKLFEPIQIRSMILKNRIVMSPMQTRMGFRNRRAIAYYEERARGGAGAITMAGTPVDLFISDEAWGKAGACAAFLKGASSLIEVVHRYGAKIGVQLWHGNRFPIGMGDDDTRGDAVAPSAMGDMRELTIAEVQEIVSKFAESAARAREAGFDFVEIHGGHGYLPCQFFSPADNHRRVAYGGSLDGRMRFGLESVKATRDAVGQDYPVFFRLGAREDRPGGITLEEGATFARELGRAGADVIDVSIGGPDGDASAPNLPGAEHPQGTFLEMAQAVKREVEVTVAAVGRIKTPDFAEAIVSQGKADLVYLGRQLLADPFWPEKAYNERWQEIAPCISCNTCYETGFKGGDLKCAVNAATGREWEYQIAPSAEPKQVLVIGGGPAGMEVARIAAQRGHRVTLYEKGERLGGQLLLAAAAPFKDEIGSLVRYLVGEMERSGVKVGLKEEVSAQDVEEAKPDVVVVATGATPFIPSIPGVKGNNVVSASEVLGGREDVGNKVVIIGGGMVGCETAELLAMKGKKVTILEMLEELAGDLEPSIRVRLLPRLRKTGIEMVTGATVDEVIDRGVRAAKGGSPAFYEADTVVLAVGLSPNKTLVEKLAGKVLDLHSIGDCHEPRKIKDAIHDGARLGREI